MRTTVGPFLAVMLLVPSVAGAADLRNFADAALHAVQFVDEHVGWAVGDDGVVWHAYEFKWKPGDLTRRPAFVTPHLPRLDWQMWFAALGNWEDNPWFRVLVYRLLHGSPSVLALIEHNPFPDRPPVYVRAMLYRYHFTGSPERQASGDWWRRELLGPYSPVISIRKPDPH